MNLFGYEIDNNTLIMAAIGAVLFWLLFAQSMEMPDLVGEAGSAVGTIGGALQGLVGDGGQAVDFGMYSIANPNAFGTTNKVRNETYSVRPEHNQDPYPLGYGCKTCGKNCAKGMKGIPDPTPGHTHVCKSGPPSKRIVDMYGSNYSLPVICAKNSSAYDAPSDLARWFKRKGCANVEDIGLSIRSSCTRC